jgi:hypothetical protein
VRRSLQVSIRVFAAVATVLLVAGGVAELASTTSCAATVTNNPLRSFQNARDVDVVCMQTLSTEDGGGVPVQPLPQSACTPVPVGIAGAILPNHLFALVTQTTRGEVAVVDLTAGYVVDEDLGTPGTNLLPVGQSPTGIASAPDGKISYVAAAEVNKPAIYALPSKMILGNSQQLEAGLSPNPPLLTSWPVCALPETPGPITIVPNPPPEPGGDAGAGDADAGDAGTGDAGTDDAGGAAANSAGYVLAVVFPGGENGELARVVTYDPLPLMRGGGVVPKDGGTVDPPGALKPCTKLGEVLVSGATPDAGAAVGPNWTDGVKWLDGGVDAPVPLSASCSTSPAPSGVLPPPPQSPAPLPTFSARAGQYLYVGDGALPVIHVFDLTSPSEPREIAPLRAVSAAEPRRQVVVGAIAVSPTTRDYKRFLYAVDASDSPASIMVFDITDPVASPHVPLRRPHSSLTPLSPADRIQFASGVSTLAFVQHDWPLAQTPSGAITAGAAQTGLLCNPNANVDRALDGGLLAQDAGADAQQFTDPGANYRNSSIPFTDEQLGPARLRGIFAFATLSNGSVFTIDVDDWDAPCRRPAIMGPTDAGNDAVTSGYTSAIAPPEPNSGNHDVGALDPYEAPYTGLTNGISWVSEEVFFPVSAPHRVRSQYPLRNDPTQGIHYPYIVGVPQLYGPGPDGGAGASLNGSVAAGNPIMLPTATTLPDQTVIADGGSSIRLAWEDPTAEVDQTWTVDYEGILPGTQGIIGYLSKTSPLNPNPTYTALVVSVNGGNLCSAGIEDWTVGKQRAAAFLKANEAAGLPDPPQGIDNWVGDYVQVADNLLPPTDPYWSSDPDANQTNDCWDGFNDDATHTGTPPLTDPTDRYNTCYAIFGPAGDESLIARDFPITQAFDDGLVVTRYYYPTSTKAAPIAASTQNRKVAPADPTNKPAMKQLACCFHNETTFNVRTGGEWLTTGATSGYLHHIIVDPTTGRCVTSCDPERALLNSRDIGIASATGPGDKATPAAYPGRDSPLAMRNPTFAYFIEHPFVPDPSVFPTQAGDAGAPLVAARPPRDLVWQFTLQGQLAPLSINLAATNSSVSPQSMLFIPSLGQLAIVDGSQSGQGLILIDLNTVSVTGNTYY